MATNQTLKVSIGDASAALPGQLVNDVFFAGKEAITSIEQSTTPAITDAQANAAIDGTYNDAIPGPIRLILTKLNTNTAALINNTGATLCTSNGLPCISALNPPANALPPSQSIKVTLEVNAPGGFTGILASQVQTLSGPGVP